jgi:hypothetical protein
MRVFHGDKFTFHGDVLDESVAPTTTMTQHVHEYMPSRCEEPAEEAPVCAHTRTTQDEKRCLDCGRRLVLLLTG